MAYDPDDIVRQAKQVDEHYQAVVAYVQGAEAQTATAYEAELTVFRAVLALGAQLLELFFMTRARSDPAPVTAEGRRNSPHDGARRSTFRSSGLSGSPAATIGSRTAGAAARWMRRCRCRSAATLCSCVAGWS